MKKIRKITSIQNPAYEAYSFYCPGCKGLHVFYVKGESLSWTFNGDLERPTFSPSLLNHLPGEPHQQRCHLVLTDGVIHYQKDCFHGFAEKSVPIEPMD